MPTKREDMIQQVAVFVPDSNQQYVYRIWHSWEDTRLPFHIQLHYPPEPVMQLLVAHLQFGASKFSRHYEMSNEDLGLLLTTFYEAIIIPQEQIQEYELNGPINSIDMYANWEMHMGMFDQVMGVKAFYREGLKEMIEKLVAEDRAKKLTVESADNVNQQYSQDSRAANGNISYMYPVNGYKNQLLAVAEVEANSFVPDVNQQYIYGFRDNSSLGPSVIYVRVPYPPTAVIHMLVAYLQFKAYKRFSYYAMSEEDLCVLLMEFYGARIISEDELRVFETISPIYYIDTTENWEIHSHIKNVVLNLTAFHRKGLNKMIETLVAEFMARENA